MEEFLIGAGAILVPTLLFILILAWIGKSKNKKDDVSYSASLDDEDDEYYTSSNTTRDSEIERCSFCGSEGHSMPGCPVFLSTITSS